MSADGKDTPGQNFSQALPATIKFINAAMSNRDHNLSFPILFFAIGEVLLLIALFFRAFHKSMAMYVTGSFALVLIAGSVAALIHKNRRKNP